MASAFRRKTPSRLIHDSAIQDNDTSFAKVVLDSGGITAADLTDALEMAKTTKKPEMVALLEQAGAKPREDFKIDPATLAKYAGTYKGPTGNELTVAIAAPRITIGPAGAPPDQRLLLVATGEKAFKAVSAPVTMTFQAEGDKVTGFTLVQGAGAGTVYTRVEGK